MEVSNKVAVVGATILTLLMGGCGGGSEQADPVGTGGEQRTRLRAEPAAPARASLRFCVAVSPDSTEGFDFDHARRVLEKHGPATPLLLAEWQVLHDITDWWNDRSQREQAEQDPAEYFAAQHGLVVARVRGEYFVLAHTGPAKSMPTSGPDSWEVIEAAVDSDASGRPCVRVQLDAVGGSRLHALTADHIDSRIAIVVDDEVWSAPIVRSAISDQVLIVGDFGEREAFDLCNALQRPIAAANAGQP